MIHADMEYFHRRGILGVLLFMGALVSITDAATYTHLGCYYDKEEPGSRDINGLDITKTEIDLHECLETCRTRGYPYAGLQALASGGFKCFCGDSFGSWGKAASSHRSCNYTCGVSGALISCGGILANDVYYTVRVDSGYVDALQTVVHTGEKTYVNARRQCVQNGGDLQTLENNDINNSTVYLANQKGITTGHVWFGLRQRFMNASSDYEWVQPQITKFDINSYKNKFHENSIMNPCVALLPDLKLWKSTSCQIPYPFTCKQLSPDILVTTPVPTEGVVSADDEEEGGASLLSLYIVLPLFAFCYGGSCIAYCVYKGYKSCKRSKKEKMLLTNMEAVEGHEYEPDTKPRPPPARPWSGGKGRVVPAPPPGHHPGARPMYGPPPPGHPGARPPPPHHRPPPPRHLHHPPPPKPQTPRGAELQSPRPATSDAVELEVKETPRGAPPPPVKSPIDDTRPKSRADRKREKLLENALKESRERKARETGTPTPTGNIPRAPVTPRTGGRGDPHSDSANLLSDRKGSPTSTTSDQSQDPTQMSIGEILKMKMAASNNRKRAKKIIQS